MSQKRRCWTAAAICAILASGARVPALPGPALSGSHDPFANAPALPAVHASFAVATEVTAGGDDDNGRQDGQENRGDAGGPRPFTADAIFAAIHADPLAVRAHTGVLSTAGEFRSSASLGSKHAGGERGFDGTPHGSVNPEIHAGAHWGGGPIGPLAVDTTNGNSPDPRRTTAGGRHPGDHVGTGPIVTDGPPPITIPPDPAGFPTPIGVPAGGAGFPGSFGAPPPPAMHAVPLPAPLGLGLSGLAFAALSVRKRLGLRR